ncbi:hypothetical protein S83_065384 [Arachis hypogaea]
MTSDCAEELKEMSMAMKEIAQAIERTNAEVWKPSEITEAVCKLGLESTTLKLLNGFIIILIILEFFSPCQKIFACNGWVKSCVGDFMIVFKIFDDLWGYYGSFWFFLK